MNEIDLPAGTRPFPPARHSSRALTWLLWMVASAILTQAVLAGLFISATSPVLMTHAIVGSLLSWFAIAPAAVAIARRRELDPRLVTGSILLPIGLWVQSTLGHMPFAVSTAIHVPFGVGLFAASVILAIVSARTGDIG